MVNKPVMIWQKLTMQQLCYSNIIATSLESIQEHIYRTYNYTNTFSETIVLHARLLSLFQSRSLYYAVVPYMRWLNLDTIITFDQQSHFGGPQFVHHATTLHNHQLQSSLRTCCLCQQIGLVVWVYSADTVPPLLNNEHSSSTTG